MTSNYYTAIYYPPTPSTPADLALASADGRLTVTFTEPTDALVRFSFVEITQVEDDWTHPTVLSFPKGESEQAIDFYPGPIQIWARAWAMDMYGNRSAVSAEVTITTSPGISGSLLVPLTTTVAGVPQLVWDENDNMVFTEVAS